MTSLSRRLKLRTWTAILLLSVSCLPVISPLPGSYDPEPLTPFNGLKIQRSPLFQNTAGSTQNTFYDEGGGNDVRDSRVSADGSHTQAPYWPVSIPSSTLRPTVIGYAAPEPGRPTPSPIAIQVTPRAYASDSALFRSSLPENQRRTYQPTTYQAGGGGGFPLLNSPNGVSYGDGRPTAVPPAARTYGVDALPPNFYFINPKDSSSQPPAKFQTPSSNFPVQVQVHPPSRGFGNRRIPEGLRRTQFYPSDDQPLSPLVRSSYSSGGGLGVTPYSVAPENPPSPSYTQYSAQHPYPLHNPPATDTYETYHTFYAPKYNNYIPITRYSHDANPTNGQYNVEFESGNGIYQKETGYIKKIQAYNPRSRQYEVRDINVKTGTVSWTSPEGIPFTLSYIADENGFRPVGSHIPSDGSGAAAADGGVINGNRNNIAVTVTPAPKYGRSFSYDEPVIPPNPLYHRQGTG